MSFWSFIGEFALFNMLWNKLSGSKKRVPLHSYGTIPKYVRDYDCQVNRYGEIDDLYDRIDDLESQLDDCEIMSDRYDIIQNEIDLLEDRLDDIEFD